MTVEARKLQIALKCQMVTGSYEGKSKSCLCIFSSECNLTKTERDVFKDDERVIHQSVLNRLEYERLERELETTQEEME
jgi:hypothetical protein